MTFDCNLFEFITADLPINSQAQLNLWISCAFSVILQISVETKVLLKLPLSQQLYHSPTLCCFVKCMIVSRRCLKLIPIFWSHTGSTYLKMFNIISRWCISFFFKREKCGSLSQGSYHLPKFNIKSKLKESAKGLHGVSRQTLQQRVYGSVA